MYNETVERPLARPRLAVLFDRTERAYLVVLRVSILIVATLLLAWCLWLAVSSIYKISGSPDSVVEQKANVTADELTDAETPAANDPSNPARKAALSNSTERAYYSDFASRYYGLFRAKFEPYRHADDKQLTKDAFDGAYLNTAARLQAIKSGELNFNDDQNDLENLLATMTEAADKPKTLERLNRYKQAHKVPVTSNVQRTSFSMERGWDSSSQACPDWYNEPIGCGVERPVEHNYTQAVTTLQYPAGTESHAQIFRAFQDRYFSLLQHRREANAANAEHQRQDIIGSIAEGKLSLLTALEVLGGFLALMFFFLLIAIERHQRRISSQIGSEGSAAEIAEQEPAYA